MHKIQSSSCIKSQISNPSQTEKIQFHFLSNAKVYSKIARSTIAVKSTQAVKEGFEEKKDINAKSAHKAVKKQDKDAENVLCKT